MKTKFIQAKLSLSPNFKTIRTVIKECVFIYYSIEQDILLNFIDYLKRAKHDAKP